MQMKKLYLTFTMISAIGLQVFFGCSKEAGENPGNQETVFQPSEKDLQIESKILAFKQKVEFARQNPNLKSGDDLTIEDAVWNVEALANYTYADASTGFDDYISETSEIEVPLTNGLVSITDAGTAYNQIIDTLTEQYNQIPGQDKHLVMADVMLKETDGQSATFDVTAGFAKGTGSSGFSPFNINDHWKYGLGLYNMGGYCDGPYEGTQKDKDAAEKIQYKINWRIAIPLGHQYFIDIKEVYVDGLEGLIFLDPYSPNQTSCECCDLVNPNDLTVNDNMYDHYMFRSYSGYPNHHECLSPSEMNFYLNSMEYIIYNIIYQCFPTELDGKIFSSSNIIGNYLINYNTTYFHEAYIYYGTSVGSGITPQEL
jgi:hypothetical protein